MTDKTAGSFDALLDEMGETLTKALPADGAAEGEAAAEAEAEGAEGEDGEDDKPMAKSFMLTLDDGTEVPAIDGSELIKALNDRVERNETKVGDLLKSMVGTVVAQGALIKSLTDQVATLGNQGKGRKAVVAVAERPAPAAEILAKAEGANGVSGEDFMTKALTLQAAGKLSGYQVAVAEQHINIGQQPPADIVRAVLG